MAEAYVNAMAKEMKLDVVAESAGTVEHDRLNPVAVQAMAEDDIDLSHHRPKMLTPEMVAHADRIISMGCGVDAESCPTRFMVTEDWGLDDPAGQPLAEVKRIRDEIKEKVTELLESVSP